MEDILELRPGSVGPAARFFEVGGTSLNMMRLLSRLRTDFDVPLDAREILTAPRMHHIAALLDERTAAATPREAGRGHGFRRGGHGTPVDGAHHHRSRASPLFCVHASGGSAVPFFSLARSLGEDQPLYGIEAVGLHGEEAATTVDAMARRYIEGVRAVRPAGPYLLTGWSLGGTVALAMAGLLREQGGQVPQVVLLDCAVPPVLPEPPPHTDMLTGFVHDLRRKISAYLDTVRAGLTSSVPPFDGVVHQFVASEGGAAYADGWGALADRVELHEVPGSHYTLLQPPHADRVGVIMREVLDLALTRTSKG